MKDLGGRVGAFDNQRFGQDKETRGNESYDKKAATDTKRNGRRTERKRRWDRTMRKGYIDR